MIALVVALAAVVTEVRTQAPDVARIPVRIVQGRLVVACQIAAQKRIAANLFVDYDAPVGLVLHKRAAEGIVAENDDGSRNAITIFLPDIDIAVAERGGGNDTLYDDFTKWWSKDLGEIPVVGTIGARVLSNYHATFDLAAGFLELSAPHEQSAEKSEEAPADVEGTFTVPLTIFDDKAWVQVGFGDRQSGVLALATSTFDSWIANDVCKPLGHPSGDIGPVRLRGSDLAQYVAFRPADVHHEHPDVVFGLTGLNLLSHFSIEIDRVNRFARIKETRAPSFPASDLAYFKARVDGTPEVLERWLEAFPKERFAREASLHLVELLLDTTSGDARIERALAWVLKSAPEDLQATSALALMDEVESRGASPRKSALLLAAGKLGLENGRKDRYPDAVHKLHARLGEILFEAGDRHEAWKHLLSAAFGLPEDGPLNLSLARYYEEEGRFTRAFSRYLQALLSPDSGSEGIEGLLRVQARLPEPESFSVDTIEKLVEGRIQGFGVAARFEPIEGRTYSRTVLSELFTNAHFEGEIGVTLARDGLRDFFPPERLVLVTYHVTEPELDPLSNPLSVHMCETYADSAASAHRFDSSTDGPPAGLVKHKEKIFDVTKKIVTSRLADDSEHTLEVTAAISQTGIKGRVIVRGPAGDEALVQILLVERGVLFPGKSKVLIHRNVARAALTKALEGEPFAPRDGSMSIDFDRTWNAIMAENAAFLDQEEAKQAISVPRFASRIDPRQARVVVILRAQDTGSVLQATQLDPELPEDMK